MHSVSDVQLCGYPQAIVFDTSMWFLLSFAHCSSLATRLLNIDHPVAEPGCQGTFPAAASHTTDCTAGNGYHHLDAHIDSDFVCRFIL